MKGKGGEKGRAEKQSAVRKEIRHMGSAHPFASLSFAWRLGYLSDEIQLKLNFLCD